MIAEFVKAWEENKHLLRQEFEKAHPEEYIDIVRGVIKIITKEEHGHDLDPNRIHQIDDGEYQGTLVFVIAATGYQPWDYWYVKVSYGSCSGCDTLMSIQDGFNWGEDNRKPNKQQVDDYMTLALHILQGLKKMEEEQ